MFLLSSFKYYCMRAIWYLISTHPLPKTTKNKNQKIINLLSCVLLKIWSCYFYKIDKNATWKNAVLFINYWIRNYPITLWLITIIILLYFSSSSGIFYSCLVYLMQFHKMVAAAAVAGTGCLRPRSSSF